MEVKTWEEIVIIPTYGTGKPEKNPIFLEKRVYQGSIGVVYPHPVIEKIYDHKENKEWQAIFLENKYLKIMILPELGGRVQMAYDKIKQRHFVYYNQVIKPALVGLAGPWISGGIEFNWPQHHRPSTFDPVDFLIEKNPDGSKTVWCSEVERMFRIKGMAGFTLYPGKAYLEVKVKLYNRTPHPQTFLWWANPAVHVNDEYQSVFPPDVNAVFDHGKRDVSRFPIATGTYYKVDYSEGVDISKYKNIPVPTSYMAITSKYDFIGCYENDTKGGMFHVANHHISPGKKQWTWGNGDFGKAWDRNLTDEDGPYIELMCGVYTDNQPDFSWLMPYEEKSFNQYFMPYRDLGAVKNATKEALINLDISEGQAIIKIYTTSGYKNTSIILTCKNKKIFHDKTDLSPEISYEKSIQINPEIKAEDLNISVIADNGKILVSWQPEKSGIKPVPDPAKPAKQPGEIPTNEQLYLTGLHLEQYRHATYSPTDYYLEALRRDKGDIRNNNAMGLWLLRKGKFNQAEEYFRSAIETLTERNPNPYDGEPYFNLGMALRFQNREQEAYETFYKAIWNDAWKPGGYFQLAQIAASRNEWENALELVDQSLIRHWHNHKARHLKAIIFRKLGNPQNALIITEESLSVDRFNFGISYEKYLLTKDDNILVDLKKLFRGNIHNYIEYALDYAWAGLYDEATDLLNIGIKEQKEDTYPMAYYYLGWFANRKNDKSLADKYFVEAEKAKSDYCFPNQLESVLALQTAINTTKNCSKAYCYLGNFWYHNRQYPDAIECWEKSLRLNDGFPTVHRNLSLAYFNKTTNPDKALAVLEKAFYLDPTDARVLMELDLLYKRLNRPYKERLEFLEKYPALVEYRDDLYLERLSLYNMLGNFEKAYTLIMDRKFHPWEGGEGKVTRQYKLSLIEMAKISINNKNYKKAIELLEKAKYFPENLGEGKLPGAQENDINYWMGAAYNGLNDENKAKKYWKMASEGLNEPAAVLYYNDQQPDKIFYQGLALLKLNEFGKARGKFNKLIDYGEKHIFDKVKMDYFAVSLPDLLIWEDDPDKRNRLHCLYLMALGYMGLNQTEKAEDYFNRVLSEDLYHIGALIHKNLKF